MFPRLTARHAGLLFAVSLLAACAPAVDLQVENGEIRALLPGRDTTAGYFSLTNHTATAVTLVGATSGEARAIEMHRTVVKDDRVSMQRVPEVQIDPGQTVAFERGGLHLMIFGVERITEPFPVMLQFADGRQVAASFSKLSN